MGIRGKVYIVPQPETKSWKLVVENTGNQSFGITQNILPPNDPNRTAHDDHGRYGHGLPVDPGKVSWQEFFAGDTYNHGDASTHVVGETSYLRVGIRNHANYTLQLPPLDGPPVEVDVTQFNWYSGSPDQAPNAALNAWAGSAPYKPNAADGAAVLSHVQALIEQHSTKGIKCEGRALVAAVPGKDGQLSHWEVRFENSGEQAWIGTVTFSRGQKNAGIGLESMACPGKDTAAVQRIEKFGNYGVEAQAGELLRLGVRGYSWIETQLPQDGVVELPLTKFKLDTKKMSPEFFDPELVAEKRNEKREKVQFFENGEPITEALEPKLWRGDDARARSTFDAPRLVVEKLEPTKDLPKGGWRVKLTNQCPEFDDEGRVGFAAAVKLADANAADPKAHAGAVQKLQYPGATAEWVIPAGEDLGGAEAKTGAELSIATRGLGWFASVKLPAKGKVVDSAQDDELWGLREDQYNRRALRPEFLQRLKV